ncbi:alpha-L-arabinofuranosidase 1-like [Cicer arietinum]|uniref:Alpha-L-arabinofuranosidase 1-like n=1 Tax=Cicer arietinum TaxID=3827 RepID=A0A1S2XDP6_CICAR|nr:alpha-L-arabinofuranosidase 1-like [Cicer arietinum]
MYSSSTEFLIRFNDLQFTIHYSDLAIQIKGFTSVTHNDEVDTTVVLPFIYEDLDGIEFARGDPTSKWSSIRASMGHLEPFNMKYVVVGNEGCGKNNYLGNYLKFYIEIRRAYLYIEIISNYNGSSTPLDHPADMYDYRIYTSANDMFSRVTIFNQVTRNGPKTFVSEYAVTRKDVGQGSLLVALAEAEFLIGLENNRFSEVSY